MRALTIGELETIRDGAQHDLLLRARRAPSACPEVQPDPGHLHRRPRGAARRHPAAQAGGLDLEAIREQLAPRVHAASENGEDLVARQGEETRRAILLTAAREFARNGYRQTRIADIIAELGITPQLLYSYFPTKRDLFAAVVPRVSRRDDGHHRAAPRRTRTDPRGPPPLAHGRRLRPAGAEPGPALPRREAAYDDPTTTRELRRAHEHVLPARRGTSSGCARRRMPAALRRAPVLRPVRRVPDHAHAGLLGRPVLAQRRDVDQRPPAPGRPDAVRRDASTWRPLRERYAGSDRRTRGTGSADSSGVRA